MSVVTGPETFRVCGYCDGDGAVMRDDGRMPCPCCDGSGRHRVELRPFVTLGAAQEHLGALRVALGVRRTEKFKPAIGTPAYHADALEDYLQSLFQQLVVMLPEEHERTEGDE